MKEIVLNRPAEQSAKEEMDEEVFKRTFIPRSLSDVLDHEKDISKVAAGNLEGVSAFTHFFS